MIAEAKTARLRKPISVRRLRKLRESNSSSGCFSWFVPLSARKGAKLSCKSQRDRTYKFQAKLAKFGLAPRVFQKFEITVGDITWYGYVTERATPAAGVNPSGGTNWDTLIQHDKQPLVDALTALGARWKDFWPRNYGFLGKKIVILDCDPAFFELDNDSPLRDRRRR